MKKRHVVIFIIAIFFHLPTAMAAFPICSDSVIKHETKLDSPSPIIVNDTNIQEKNIDTSMDTKGKLLNVVSFILAISGLTLGIFSVVASAIPMALLAGLSGLTLIATGGIIGLNNSIEPSHKKHVKFTTKRHRTLSLSAVFIAFLAFCPLITCISLIYWIVDEIMITRKH